MWEHKKLYSVVFHNINSFVIDTRIYKVLMVILKFIFKIPGGHENKTKIIIFDKITPLWIKFKISGDVKSKERNKTILSK